MAQVKRDSLQEFQLGFWSVAAQIDVMHQTFENPTRRATGL